MDYFIRSCTNNYKKEAYILKLDIRGYFMSIDKQMLYEIIEKKLTRRQNDLKCDLGLILFLIRQVIFCDPTIDCVIKSPRGLWQGLPIGNLTSQLFANIYLNEVDQFIKRGLNIKYYGRYVDDMVLVDNDKYKLLEAVKKISDYLTDNLSLSLHPKKIYLQHADKGVVFLGFNIKPYRVLVGKRIKRNFYGKISDGVAEWHRLCVYPVNKDDLKIFNYGFRQTCNSYLGLLRYSNSFL